MMQDLIRNLVVFLMVIAILRPGLAAAGDVVGWFESGTQKVFPDSKPTGKESGELYAARNEYEVVQLVLRAESDISGLKVKFVPASEKGLPVRWVKLFEAWYVSTPGIENTWGFPEQYPESRRPVYPDPLAPLVGGDRDGTIALQAGETKSVWVEVHVPAGAKPGEYSGELVVTWGKSGSIKAPVKLRVWPFALPQATSVKTAVGLTRHDISKAHNVEQKSEECDALYKRYYDELLAHRICAYLIPYRLTDPRAKEYMLDERVNTFNAYGHKFGGRHDLVQLDQSEREYELLERLGVVHKAWLYMEDEPLNEERYKLIRNQASGVRREMPKLRYGVPFFVGPQWDKSLTPIDELTGYVNLWIFQTDYYAHGHGQGKRPQTQLRQRFEAGDEVWWYIAHAPREPYCGLGVNMSALQHRILIWQIYAEPIITGLLYWRATHWSEVEYEPYQDNRTLKSTDPYIYGYGCLFYPGAKFGIDGPVSSIQLKCLRDGLEDHEYLVLAEEKFGREQVMKVVEDVTSSLTSFTRNPAEFNQVRLRLGEMLAQ